ncbi:MAG: hypothetical protein WBW16_06795 [Bacteroidota bacterium]
METTMENPPASIISHLPKGESSENVLYFYLDVGGPKDNHKEEVRVNLIMNDAGEYSVIWCRKDPEGRAAWREISRYLGFKTETEVETEWLNFLLSPKPYLGFY